MPTIQQTIDAIRTVAAGIDAGHLNGNADNHRKMADRMQKELDASPDKQRITTLEQQLLACAHELALLINGNRS